MSGHDGLREALNEAARDAHALTVRLLRNPVCSGPFETCPSPYCTRSRAALAEPVQPETAEEQWADLRRENDLLRDMLREAEERHHATPPAGDPVGLDVEAAADAAELHRIVSGRVDRMYTLSAERLLPILALAAAYSDPDTQP
jgi:hypothetical protein